MVTINFFPIEHMGASTTWLLVGLVCHYTVQSSLSVFWSLLLLLLRILPGPSFKKRLPGFTGKLVATLFHKRKPCRDWQQWRGCWLIMWIEMRDPGQPEVLMEMGLWTPAQPNGYLAFNHVGYKVQPLTLIHVDYGTHSTARCCEVSNARFQEARNPFQMRLNTSIYKIFSIEDP